MDFAFDFFQTGSNRRLFNYIIVYLVIKFIILVLLCFVELILQCSRLNPDPCLRIIPGGVYGILWGAGD